MTPVADRPGAVRAWATALVLLSAGVLWIQFRHIDSTLPYPRHVDEEAVSAPAFVGLVTGSFHPSNFNYPSLPTYLAAGGMAVGFLRAAGRQEIQTVESIGNVGYPYYATPAVMQGARQLYALLAIVALAVTGMSAWLALRRPVLVVLAPVVLLTSLLYFDRSWSYLNVDIVGACFVSLTIAACLLGTRHPSMLQLAVIPGALAGLATASKYSLAVAILPVLLAIGFEFTGIRRLHAWLAALAAMVAAFVVAVPYSLLDLPAFLNGVGFDMYHYAAGHAGFDGPPGLSQLRFYAGHLASEFGTIGVMLAIVGLCVCAAADWRRAAVLAAFPVALLWLLTSQRVHFTRNALSLHAFVAVFAAFGLAALHGWATGLAARTGWGRWMATARGRAVVGVVLVFVALPWWHVVDHFRDRTDSRNQARAWIEARLPDDWTIVIPSQLGFDPRPLEAEGRHVVVVDFPAEGDAASIDALRNEVPSPALILAPRWGADPRFEGAERAAVLNAAASRWKVIESFGINPVLVNYANPVAFANPAFAAAVFK